MTINTKYNIGDKLSFPLRNWTGVELHRLEGVVIRIEVDVRAEYTENDPDYVPYIRYKIKTPKFDSKRIWTIVENYTPNVWVLGGDQ